MAKMNCNEDQYIKDGKCSDYCPPGSYMQADGTQCVKCERGFYTATKNHLPKCLPCKTCSSSNQKKVTDCPATEDTVCECEAGFYCSNDECEHCQAVKHCIPGEGVKVQATRTKDTVCAPCKDGTFSNVTDFWSTCQTHTRCEEIGREEKTPGTRKTDAICGDLKLNCHWMVPAGLWSGLVLTALILFGLFCWRKKRKSYRNVTAHSCVPVTLDDVVPTPPVGQLELPLPSTELNGHCQESCIVECYELKLFNGDIDTAVSCNRQDSLENSTPITPLKVSFSFADSNHTNTGYGTENFLRTYSEPQEDEYCGT